MTDRERIALGECVSEYTVDRCPVCVDRCEASIAKQRVSDLLEGTKVDKPKSNNNE